MDHQIISGLFTQTIRSAEILGLDPELRTRLLELRRRLPPLQVGIHGQIMEWSEDYDEPEPGTVTFRSCSRFILATRSRCGERRNSRGRRALRLSDA